MKLLDFLKKPISNYNRSNQKKFIMESDIQPKTNQVTSLKKKSYSFKSSKQFLNDLMQKKRNSSGSINRTPSVTSQSSDHDNYTNMCFDNYAYGSFISNEIYTYHDDNNTNDNQQPDRQLKGLEKLKCKNKQKSRLTEVSSDIEILFEISQIVTFSGALLLTNGL